MTDRLVVLLLGASVAQAAPPGCDGVALAAAMAEDVLAVFSELDGIDEAIAFRDPAGAELARSIAWPGTALIELAAAASPADLLCAVAERGYRQAAIVAPDAPDLPALHLAKAFSALGSAAAAVALAVNGGVVIVASRLPASADLDDFDLDVFDLDGFQRSGAAAPDRSLPAGVRQTLPWHRLRRPADLALLDPGLEGWEATRGLLSGHRP
ncbi:MAG: DUF2064 domain-containing protein [Geodermatophilaceae bacterium]|nr:DUF2064 domain-containing protein [Geodermatophilaceae bacterium]MDQ3466267.1 DUF2064 domain-containing protein [Actinomycetota bacterium]